jgi:hypothetical protein
MANKRKAEMALCAERCSDSDLESDSSICSDAASAEEDYVASDDEATELPEEEDVIDLDADVLSHETGGLPPSSENKERKERKEAKKKDAVKKKADAAKPAQRLEERIDLVPPLTLTKATTTLLTKLTFAEAIDPKTCQRMIGARVLGCTRDGSWKDRERGCTEETQVQKIMLAATKGGGQMPVRYLPPKCGFGRVNPKGSLSLGSLRKAVRHTLCGDAWWDFDVANCHPAILLQLCRAHRVPCGALAHYVDNRAACLGEVAALFKAGTTPEDKHDAAKTLFIIVMYGGGPDKWCREHKDALIVAEPEIPSCVGDLQSEVASISAAMQLYNPAMVQAVTELRQKACKTDNNFAGSFLSYYAQEWERRVLEAVLAMMRENGYVTNAHDCVLCFDGIMVRKEHMVGTTPEAVTTKCETAVKLRLGLTLTFTVKPLTKSLLPQIEAAEQTQRDLAFPADKLVTLDTKYLNNLETYAQKKRYAEHFLAKTMRPEARYVWKNERKETDEHGIESSRHVSISYNKHGLADALQHVRSGVFVKHCETAFTDEWFKDPEIRVYTRVDFLPRGLQWRVRPCAAQRR